MLTQLSNVKYRLGMAETEIAHDALLAMFIQSVTTRFNKECNRVFGRTVNATHEFAADELNVVAPCYPIESVLRLELMSTELDLWVEQPDASWQVRHRCVITLPRALGLGSQLARVIYTGGYVLPGVTLEPGQEKLPADLEQSAVEQVAFWYQHRDRHGLERIWEYHSTYRQFATEDLLPAVQAVLANYRRIVL